MGGGGGGVIILSNILHFFQAYDKFNIEKHVCKAYQEQRNFKRTKPAFIDFNEITNLKSAQNEFSNHIQYQTIAIDDMEKSMNQTSCFNGKNNLRCFKHKTEGEYDCKDGYNFHKNSQSSNIKTSFPYPNCNTQMFQGEYFDAKSFIPEPKKCGSIMSKCRHQPQKTLKVFIVLCRISQLNSGISLPCFMDLACILQDNVKKEIIRKNSTAFQPEMLMKSRSNVSRVREKLQFIFLFISSNLLILSRLLGK